MSIFSGHYARRGGIVGRLVRRTAEADGLRARHRSRHHGGLGDGASAEDAVFIYGACTAVGVRPSQKGTSSALDESLVLS